MATTAGESPFERGLNRWGVTLRRWLAALGDAGRRKPLGALSAIVLLLIGIGAVFAPFVTLNDPQFIFTGASFAKAGSTPEGGRIMLLGGDAVGRDLFSRLVLGARVSMGIGLGSVALGISLGTAAGLASGYLGGKVDLVIQRIVDAAMAIPPLVLALTVVTLLGPSFLNVLFAIGVIGVPHTARFVRGMVLGVKENVYIEAARAIGAGNVRITFRHVLPNVTHGIIVIAATWLAGAVVLEATISFLGQGTPPPTPTWGGMLTHEGGRANMIQHPMLLAGPASAIAITVFAFNFLGDAARDLLDPRLRI